MGVETNRRTRRGAEDDHGVIDEYLSHTLWSRDAVELDIARFSDFGHVQVAAEVEERI